MTPFATLRSSCLTLLLASLCPVAAAAQLADCPDATALRLEVDRQKARLDDWPQLRRYADANAALAPPPRAKRASSFWAIRSPTRGTIRAMAASSPASRSVNRGIGGQTTPQMVLRMRADVIALQPKALVLLAGTNDLAGNNGATDDRADRGQPGDHRGAGRRDTASRWCSRRCCRSARITTPSAVAARSAELAPPVRQAPAPQRLAEGLRRGTATYPITARRGRRLRPAESRVQQRRSPSQRRRLRRDGAAGEAAIAAIAREPLSL